MADPIEVRRRVIKTIEALPLPEDAAAKSAELAKRNLRTSAIQAMNIKQLDDYLVAPGSTVRIALAKGSSLITPATNYVKALEAAPQQGQTLQLDTQQQGQQGRQGRNGRNGRSGIPPNLLQRIDPQRT